MSGTNPIITVFGGTGDLTYRKLLPALYDLYITKSLPLDFHIVIIGRRDFTSQSYRQSTLDWYDLHARHQVKLDKLDAFLSHVHYYKMIFTEKEDYKGLHQYLKTLDATAHRFHYLAVAPTFFIQIANNLKESGLSEQASVIIEKPFGDDLESAIEINSVLTQIFDTKNIYRIDHYVAKEMVQNIFTIRFSNPMFTQIWNHDSIDHIQITASETVGVEKRGNFYDQTGALKDMFQNHLLQVLSIVMMPQPHTMSAKDIHKQQELLLNSLFVQSYEDDIVYGQYQANEDSAAYQDEQDVNPHSSTETYVALRLQSSLDLWKNTPIYVRTGKRLKSRYTEIVVKFKSINQQPANVLVIKVQPNEGVYLQFNIKSPGKSGTTQTVTMDYCQSCNQEFKERTPQAYERLLDAMLHQDQTLFSSFEEVKQSWAFVTEILNHTKTSPIHPYLAYSTGPLAANQLLANEGHEWVEDSDF